MQNHRLGGLPGEGTLGFSDLKRMVKKAWKPRFSIGKERGKVGTRIRGNQERDPLNDVKLECLQKFTKREGQKKGSL